MNRNLLNTFDVQKFGFLTVVLAFIGASNFSIAQNNCVYLASDVYPGSYGSSPTTVTEYNGALYFGATGDANGVELWKFENGVSSLVADINPGLGGSMPNSFNVVGSYLYFSASTAATGNELFRYDGTSVTLVADIQPGPLGSFPNTFFVDGTDIYFSANDGVTGFEPWKCVGTTVTQVADINPGAFGSTPSEIAAFNGDIFFIATSDAAGKELWKHDGTTLTLYDLYPGPTGSDIGELTVIPSHLCFRATDGVLGYELWTYDGTTVTNLNVNPTSDFTPWELTAFGNEVFLRGFVAATGYELWKFDGVSASLVMDIRPGSNNSTPNNFAVVGSNLYFAANDGTTGNELWKYNGTTAALVADIRPGSSGSMAAPSYDPFASVGDIVFVIANDGVSGYEVWSYDGTTAKLGKDIVAGTGTSTPQGMKGIGNKLYFNADNLVNGPELWVWNPFVDLDDTISVFTCSSYTSPSGAVYNTDGTYSFEDAIPSVNCPACDSLIWIDLTIMSNLISYDTVWTCDTYTSPGGNVYSADGTYDITDILPSVACPGVDSVLNIHLTIIDQIITTSFVFSGVIFVQQSGGVYQWLDCDNGNVPIPGANDQDFLPTVSGNYACQITIGSCTDTTNCSYVESTFGIGFEENGVKPLKIFPNPVTDILTIQAEGAEQITKVNIYNQLGQMVLSKNTNASFVSVDCSLLNEGVYFLNVITDGGQFTYKISIK